MGKQLLALILGELCQCAQLITAIESYNLGVISPERLTEIILVINESTKDNFEIATKLIDKEEN